MVLAHSSPSDHIHLRSHSGGGCSHVLHGCPTSPEFTVAPDVFRTIALERLFPLLAATVGRSRTASDATGPLARTQDDFGQLHPRRHWPECAGRLGQLFVPSVKLRDMNVAVRRDDERCIEVVVSGLQLYHDAQLAVDITTRSAVTRSGEARSGAAPVDGIVCMNARADEEQKYAEELLAGDRCRPWRPEGDGDQKPQGSLMVSLGPAHGRPHPTRRGRPSWRGGGDGIGCFPSLAQKRSPLPCCSGEGRCTP